MKIIGNCGHGRFIVETGIMELNQITAFAQNEYRTGDVIRVDEAFKRLVALKQRRDDLDTAKKRLRGLLRAIEPLEELVLAGEPEGE